MSLGARGPATATHRVRVRGTIVPYDVAGEGEPVLMIHGLGGSSRCWTWALPSLTRRHRVFLLDLPGFGRLRHRHRDFALDTAREWIERWMDAVGLARAHVIGHSMGAYLATQIALDAPDRVDRLVLVSAVGVPTGRSLADCIRRIPAGWRHRAPGVWQLLLRDALCTRPWLVWRTARALLAQDVRETLARIRAPTLVVWGTDDPMVPVACAEAFRNAIPSARLLLLDRAGHLPMLTKTERFSDAVVSFLANEPVGE